MEDAIIYISIAIVFFLLGATAMYYARNHEEEDYYEELFEEYSAFMKSIEDLPKGTVVPITPRQLEALNYFSGSFAKDPKYIIKE